jgi:hypothetical protein
VDRHQPELDVRRHAVLEPRQIEQILDDPEEMALTPANAAELLRCMSVTDR